MRRLFRALLVAVLLIAAAAATAAAWMRAELRASLPQLAGERQLAGLHSRVTVTRDALGIPTITGATREDVARATGFLHAQERYFQMDLARRRAAGVIPRPVGLCS